MAESYTVGGDSLILLAQNVKAGQTFRPQADEFLNFVDLNLNVGLFTVRVSADIYMADANHEPIEPSLGYGSIDPGPKFPPGVKRFRIAIDKSPLLYAGGYYAIIVYHKYYIIGSAASWQYDKDDATYPRGIRISSSDNGATWTKHYNDDHIFAEFGTPPTPKPPPDPPVDNFAILDVIQIITTTGYRFYVITNVPCHLFMLYVIAKPGKHKTEIIRRGERWKDAIRFCFVNPIKNEQEEQGDTIYHTFIKEPWAGCETRWFTFRATIDEAFSPSSTAIFVKHRPLGLLFAEQYTLAAWPPTLPLFAEPYTLYPYPPTYSKIFDEAYTWEIT